MINVCCRCYDYKGKESVCMPCSNQGPWDCLAEGSYCSYPSIFRDTCGMGLVCETQDLYPENPDICVHKRDPKPGDPNGP